MRSVGLDLGSRKIVCCVIDGDGVIERRTVAKVEELEALLGRGTKPARVGFEASRGAWHVHDLLEAWGKTPLMIDTTRVKQIGIGQHGRKNDRIDAEAIARAVARGHVPRAHVLTPDRRELRRELMIRRGMMETRSTMVTMVRGIVRDAGERIPSCDVDQFVPKARSAKLGRETLASIEPLLSVIETVDRQLVELDARVEKLAGRDTAFEMLTSAPGVSLVTAAMFLSVIDDPHRFDSARKVAAYLGLVPREDSTGLIAQRLGSITKQGNAYARSLLVQGAWAILRGAGGDDPLARWGKDVAKRRGKRIAAIAIARRLAMILWAMWRRRAAYDPAHVAELSAEGLERSADVIAAQAAAMHRAATKTKQRARALERRRTRAAATSPIKRTSNSRSSSIQASR